MGVSTSFFSATMAQLKAAAPGWVEPKYGDELVEIVNPFTRLVSHRQHTLLSEPPDACPPDAIRELVDRGRAFKWKLGGADLEPLMKMLTEAPEARVAELHQQALLGPADAEVAVLALPEVFVDALAAVKDVDALAKEWQRALRSEDPPKALLEELVAIAREARAAGQRMFSYVSL